MHGIALSLRNVGVSYYRGFLGRNRYWALKDVSFDLYHGETLGVIGRNGVGKSTLLKLIAQIIGPDNGEVINFGCSMSLLSLQVGFVPHLTGRENAILSGILLGMEKQQVLDNMDKIIEFAELEDFIDEPVKVYSDGMRARLGFSVSLYANPDVLLIDEIMGVGDAVFQAKSREAMRKRMKSDKTVVIVSHSAPLLQELCDRVVWIENGISIQAGETKEVLSMYHQSLTDQSEE